MLSYPGLTVFIPNCVLVVYGCVMRKGYHSCAGSIMGHVKGVLGE